MSKYYDGLDELSNACTTLLSDDTVEVYLKLYLLLYADDTIILSETSADLQSALNAMHSYSSHWKLDVNVNKTKIMIFFLK